MLHAHRYAPCSLLKEGFVLPLNGLEALNKTYIRHIDGSGYIDILSFYNPKCDKACPSNIVGCVEVDKILLPCSWEPNLRLTIATQFFHLRTICFWVVNHITATDNWFTWFIKVGRNDHSVRAALCPETERVHLTGSDIECIVFEYVIYEISRETWRIYVCVIVSHSTIDFWPINTHSSIVQWGYQLAITNKGKVLIGWAEFRYVFAALYLKLSYIYKVIRGHIINVKTPFPGCIVNIWFYVHNLGNPCPWWGWNGPVKYNWLVILPICPQIECCVPACRWHPCIERYGKIASLTVKAKIADT